MGRPGDETRKSTGKILHLFIHKDPLGNGIPQAYALHFTCLSRRGTLGIIASSVAFAFLCSIKAGEIVQMYPLETMGGGGCNLMGLKSNLNMKLLPGAWQ